MKKYILIYLISLIQTQKCFVHQEKFITCVKKISKSYQYLQEKKESLDIFFKEICTCIKQLPKPFQKLIEQKQKLLLYVKNCCTIESFENAKTVLKRLSANRHLSSIEKAIKSQYQSELHPSWIKVFAKKCKALKNKNDFSKIKKEREVFEKYQRAITLQIQINKDSDTKKYLQNILTKTSALCALLN